MKYVFRAMVMLFAVAIIALPALVLADSPDREAGRQLLISAYIEGESYCMEYPAGTYVTQIGGIRIHADCKTRNDYVEQLRERGLTLQDVEKGEPRNAPPAPELVQQE